jgi:hypothetical protein
LFPPGGAGVPVAATFTGGSALSAAIVRIINPGELLIKLTYGMPESHRFSANAQYEQGNPHLLVFDVTLPYWGVLGSMEFAIYRDGSKIQTLDIATTNIGIKERSDLVASVL